MTMQLARKAQEISNIQTLPSGTVLVDYGPMRMFISVFEEGKPLVELALEGADLAMNVLDELAKFLRLIKQKSQMLEAKDIFPDVVQRMMKATKMMEEADLTPLAAVAGSASDVVADFMFHRGGTKILVDNGGDIAIRLRKGDMAKVGVKTDIHEPYPSYVISIDTAMGMGGVATSGLGGRSFTKGIASSAAVFSETASFSDAAATVIGNAANTDDPKIKRALAETIYPDTDIQGEWVTTEVGHLSQEKIEEALDKGLSKANLLCQKGLIKGAFITVQGKTGWTESLNAWLMKL